MNLLLLIVSFFRKMNQLNCYFAFLLIYFPTIIFAQELEYTKICNANFLDTSLKDNYLISTMDNNNNIYIATITEGNTFRQVEGFADIIIIKYDSQCREVWAVQYGENGYDYPKQISIVDHQNQEKLELYWLQDKTGSGIRLSDSYYFSYFDINNGNLIGIPHNLILSQYDAPSVIMVGSKIDNSGSLIIYGYFGRFSSIYPFITKYQNNLFSSNILWNKVFSGTPSSNYINSRKYKIFVKDMVFTNTNDLYITNADGKIVKINGNNGDTIWERSIGDDIDKVLIDTTNSVWVLGDSYSVLFDGCSNCNHFIAKLDENNGRILFGIGLENLYSKEFILHPFKKNIALIRFIPSSQKTITHTELNLISGEIVQNNVMWVGIVMNPNNFYLNNLFSYSITPYNSGIKLVLTKLEEIVTTTMPATTTTLPTTTTTLPSTTTSTLPATTTTFPTTTTTLPAITTTLSTASTTIPTSTANNNNVNLVENSIPSNNLPVTTPEPNEQYLYENEINVNANIDNINEQNIIVTIVVPVVSVISFVVIVVGIFVTLKKRKNRLNKNMKSLSKTIVTENIPPPFNPEIYNPSAPQIENIY